MGERENEFPSPPLSCRHSVARADVPEGATAEPCRTGTARDGTMNPIQHFASGCYSSWSSANSHHFRLESHACRLASFTTATGKQFMSRLHVDAVLKFPSFIKYLTASSFSVRRLEVACASWATFSQKNFNISLLIHLNITFPKKKVSIQASNLIHEKTPTCPDFLENNKALDFLFPARYC